MLFQMFHFSKQITAVKEYDLHLSAKSLTNKHYEIWLLKEAGKALRYRKGQRLILLLFFMALFYEQW